jgi:hypothetical protein
MQAETPKKPPGDQILDRVLRRADGYRASTRDGFHFRPAGEIGLGIGEVG